jgi:twinkle protein
MADITEIRRTLESRALDVAGHLLPRGILEGREWWIGSVTGEPGKPLKLCGKGTEALAWGDFAAASERGDLIDLWRPVKGRSLVEALDGTRVWLGLTTPKFEKREQPYRRPRQAQCMPPKSAVLKYLTGAGKFSADAFRTYGVGEDGGTIVLRRILPDGELALVKHLRIDRTAAGKKNIGVEPGCEPVLSGWQRDLERHIEGWFAPLLGEAGAPDGDAS